jgi:hypothetical protein
MRCNENNENDTKQESIVNEQPDIFSLRAKQNGSWHDGEEVTTLRLSPPLLTRY